ncbi:MAG TPA: DUF6152 family protein [Micropepsaceae bacterium]|jgi:hypothetical protein
MRRLAAIAMTWLCLGSIPVSAHHSLAAYTLSNYKTVEGTVKSFEWSNPHAKLSLIAPDANGRTVNWNFEGGSIGRLTTGGFRKGSIAPGDKIVVAYNPRRDNAIGGFFIAVTTANGTTYTTDRYKQLNTPERGLP